jgi:hypothetical protein
MKPIVTSIALAVSLAFAASVQAQTDRKAAKAEHERIEAEAKADKAKCDPMKGNAKDICMAEAKGKEKVAKAELDAKTEKDHVKAQKKVSDAKAEAAYEVAAQKCDDQKGEAKDACMKQARVDRDKMKGNAEKRADAAQERKREQPSAATGGTSAPSNEKQKKY